MLSENAAGDGGCGPVGGSIFSPQNPSDISSDMRGMLFSAQRCATFLRDELGGTTSVGVDGDEMISIFVRGVMCGFIRSAVIWKSGYVSKKTGVAPVRVARCLYMTKYGSGMSISSSGPVQARRARRRPPDTPDVMRAAELFQSESIWYWVLKRLVTVSSSWGMPCVSV